MRIWLACFFLLFALAELFEWAKHFSLPLPIYILGGAFLAIASNYDKKFGLFNFLLQPQSTVDADAASDRFVSHAGDRTREQNVDILESD